MCNRQKNILRVPDNQLRYRIWTASNSVQSRNARQVRSEIRSMYTFTCTTALTSLFNDYKLTISADAELQQHPSTLCPASLLHPSRMRASPVGLSSEGHGPTPAACLGKRYPVIGRFSSSSAQAASDGFFSGERHVRLGNPRPSHNPLPSLIYPGVVEYCVCTRI